MGLRLSLVILLVALTAMMASSTSSDSALSASKNNSTTGHSQGMATCNGQIGDCIDEMEEMMLDSEASRRVLANRVRYISYAVLSKNKVPCNRRGASYYNCRQSGRANPYTRGCTVATRCARRTS